MPPSFGLSQTQGFTLEPVILANSRNAAAQTPQDAHRATQAAARYPRRASAMRAPPGAREMPLRGPQGVTRD